MLDFYNNLYQQENIPPNLPNKQHSPKHFFHYIDTIDLLENPCLIKQGQKQLILCSRKQNSNTNTPNYLSLYRLDSMSFPKLSTNFFPVHDTYTKIIPARMHGNYFGAFQIKNQNAYLTLFKLTGKGFRKITTLAFDSSCRTTNENALCFLSSPFECLFLPGDGTIKYIDLRRKIIRDEFPCNGYEGIKYSPHFQIIAAKSKEELHLLKISPDKAFSYLGSPVTGNESFQGGPSKPTVNFLITQYSDLKDYAFDEETQSLYVVFAWVAWTSKSVIFSLPPTVTHLRFQKWKIRENGLALEDQRDIPWSHNRMQNFTLNMKLKQCLVNGPLCFYVISLETYEIVEKIDDKRLFAVSWDNKIILQNIRYERN